MRSSVYVPSAIAREEVVEAVDTLCSALSEATGIPYMEAKQDVCRLLCYLCAEKRPKISCPLGR